MTTTLYCSDGTPFLVDDEDVERVQGVRWTAFRDPKTRVTYIVDRHGAGYLHRLLLLAPKGANVDHVNGDGLDNRRCNLRLATKSQNGCNARLSRANTSGVKGVFRHSQSGKWQAQITLHRKVHSVGLFSTLEEASEAIKAYRERLHGEFARHE